MFQPKHAILHPTQLPPGPLLGRSLEGETRHVRGGRARAVCGVWVALTHHRSPPSEWSRSLRRERVH